MRWREGDNRFVRSVYGLMRLSINARSVTRSFRNSARWTLSPLVLLLIAAAVGSWIAFGGFCLVMAIELGQWLYTRHYIVHSRLEETDEMTGWEFERWLERLLRDTGMDVERTPYRSDFGADFIATWNGVRIAIQAKRSARPVGVRAVQEVVAAKGYYDCEIAMVVTNNYFTDQALVLARANGVRMRFRDDLAKTVVKLHGAGLNAGDVTAAAVSN
jgi:restriction system protein